MAPPMWNGSARGSCPAIAAPWTIWSTAGPRPWADTCGRASHCGQEPYVYHSCRHRRCPTCHRQDTEAWLAERRQERLPVTSVHLVFTVPHELGEIIRQHQQDLYDILIRAAAQALIKRAADPHDVGGLMGVLCVLHTWTRTLAYHPHVHCLVPAGGVSADRTEWRPARTSYLVPVHALSKLFRGLFLGSGASGTPRSDAARGGLDQRVGGLLQADCARHSASLAVPGPVCPPHRAHQPLPALHGGWPGLLSLSRLSVLSLAHHDPPSPGVYPPLPAARVAPRLPQGPVRWAVESRPSSPPAPTPARARRAHTRTASYSPCTGEPSARLLVPPPPRRAAMSALRPRLASRDSLPPPASKGTPMRPHDLPVASPLPRDRGRRSSEPWLPGTTLSTAQYPSQGVRCITTLMVLGPPDPPTFPCPSSPR